MFPKFSVKERNLKPSSPLGSPSMDRVMAIMDLTTSQIRQIQIQQRVHSFAFSSDNKNLFIQSNSNDEPGHNQISVLPLGN